MRNDLLWLRRAGVSIITVLLLLSSARAAQDSAADNAREAPIRALLASMTDAYNRGDVGGTAAAFVPDGVMIAGDGTVITSRIDIERFLTELHTKLPKGTQFLATVTNVRFTNPDVAVLTAEGGWLMPGESAISDKNQGVHSLVALRNNGVWRAVLFQRTRKVPVPTVAK